mmetsp:Transcript_27075/g.58961  ORF Transcript_27075/g.58961 Transcript_27075/m.58961 type:complete len:461 (+) Transcript_27075:145-1527(+)
MALVKRFFCATLALSSTLVVGLQPKEDARFALVADAGSTGTRVYLFRLPTSDADGKVEITDLGKGPALSSFKANPENSHQAVASQIEKAQSLIPPEVQTTVPVSVFATAGMRLVEANVQEAIYKGMQAGLKSVTGGYRFDIKRLQTRTISGREEGIFALIAANYLAKHLLSTLKASTGTLMGVLDLGGSSTQIAAPPALLSGEALSSKLGEDDTFVRSFLNLGMERMRQRTFDRFVSSASGLQQARRAVPNPCSFYGYSPDGEDWRGVGDSKACEAAVAALLQEERNTCQQKVLAATAAADECLSSDPLEVPKGLTDKPRFFLISGYMYVTDFAGWLVKNPAVKLPDTFTPPEGERPYATPTIDELREAAAIVCSEPWSALQDFAHGDSRHKFTPAKKVPHRCFEINYIIALLSVGYGLPSQERLFHIVDEIDGGEIEWTLGAFLHGLSEFAVPQVTQEL